ncbi:carboxypeptidase-like regulatory domain-containing protein [Sabulilitoribacter arenilitoris]|uniref:Carboxypeptidase-like regulatory domain-containing protein n=1 Tax=Wocania arenilitoris TaxID=2044858 RepID=A0AAE3ENX3_9FLAO|nr:carboxypeptidase-like regulatory domain-containing protein [Wocania arenilitoris]MCF7568925.1 carboxypeptidase-like regulatory domain-containing protein [Wocania arenilitoris]
MKTQLKFTPKKVLSALGYVTILMVVSVMFNPVYGQANKTSSPEISQKERTIKGVIKNEEGPLESASITLKGSNVGTTTNSKGEFVFPKALKTDDVLLITFLGYDTVEVKIKDDTTFINQMMSEDLIEFVGALNTNKPYKSKRPN